MSQTQSPLKQPGRGERGEISNEKKREKRKPDIIVNRKKNYTSFILIRLKLIFVQKRGGQITNKTISREGRQKQHLDNCFVEFHLKYDDRKTIDSRRNNLKIRTKSKSTLFLTQLVKELRLISRSDNQGKKYHTILPFYCQNQKDPHLLMNIK